MAIRKASRPSNQPGRRKGTPKTGGRKKGTPNKAAREAKAACAEIVDDPVYRKKLLAAARKRALAPAVECMLWHYAKGKPKETMALEGEIDVNHITKEAADAKAKAMTKAQLEASVAAGRRYLAEIAAITGESQPAGQVSVKFSGAST